MTPFLQLAFELVIILLAATGVVAAIAGILGLPTALLAGMVDPAGDLMLAAVSLAGAALLLIHRDRIGAGSEGPGGIPPSRP